MKAALADRSPHRWTGRGVVHGETRWLSLEANPRFLDDASILWEGAVTDITDYKEAEASLKKVSDELFASEIARTRLEERDIMLRDMLDGFGSQLASLRFLVAEHSIDRQQLTMALNECIADLYLVIDTLGSQENTLRDTMADLRFRTARRLAELPLNIHWTLDLDHIPAQSQQTQLQILRIVQEAINNVLQHSKANNVWLEAIYQAKAEELVVRVADDGVGMAQPVRRGRGLTNMKRRADDLGAEIDWRERTPGTELVLRLRIAA
jgi:signal transduction histidine kinase